MSWQVYRTCHRLRRLLPSSSSVQRKSHFVHLLHLQNTVWFMWWIDRHSIWQDIIRWFKVQFYVYYVSFACRWWEYTDSLKHFMCAHQNTWRSRTTSLSPCFVWYIWGVEYLLQVSKGPFLNWDSSSNSSALCIVWHFWIFYPLCCSKSKVFGRSSSNLWCLYPFPHRLYQIPVLLVSQIPLNSSYW